MNDPGSGSLGDLVDLLEASGCIVERIGANSIRISAGWAVRDEASVYELDGYLPVFEGHPLGSPRAASQLDGCGPVRLALVG